MSPVQRVHSRLANRIGMYLGIFVEEHDLGEVHTELGFYSTPDRRTMLAPDVAFISHARLSGQPEDGFISVMPELAVEIASPSDSLAQLRRKARIYLDNGVEPGVDCPAVSKGRRCLPLGHGRAPRHRICRR